MAHEPLVGQHRLDHGVGAAAARHHELVRLGLLEQTLRLEVGETRLRASNRSSPRYAAGAFSLTRALSVKMLIGSRVAHADLVVVEVVRRRHLDDTGAELAVDEGVRDDRDIASGERQAHAGADEMT
jgi:hypothetical protein